MIYCDVPPILSRQSRSAIRSSRASVVLAAFGVAAVGEGTHEDPRRHAVLQTGDGLGHHSTLNHDAVLSGALVFDDSVCLAVSCA